MDRTPTLSDVAKKAGVSKGSVSAALNGSKSNTRVSDETRLKIQEAARELNYHPNAVARALTKGKTQSLAVLFGRVRSSVVTNPYAGGILEGILDGAAPHEYDVTLVTSPWRGPDSARRLANGRFDGLVIVQPFLDSDMVPALVDARLPVVVVSWDQTVTPASAVDVDNAMGIELAIDHLFRLGHRKIAHVAGEPTYASALARKQGFIRSMRARGLTIPEGYVGQSTYRGTVPPESAEISSMYVGTQILSLKDRPTAVVAANDAIALGVLSAADALGLRVPEDLSVVGFNDALVPGPGIPQLTTLHEPLQAIGRRASELLIRTITESYKTVELLIPPELIVRRTTGPAPSTLAPSQRQRRPGAKT